MGCLKYIGAKDGEPDVKTTNRCDWPCCNGKNLALNIESKGFTVSVYNRSPQNGRYAEGNRRQASEGDVLDRRIRGFLETPRKILIMVQAGQATDATIEQLIPHLDKGDIIIDGGNAYFPDTQRRKERTG